MPSRSSKQIRKVQKSSLSDFDDQLWPVNVAIVILGGIVAGVVYATSDFEDPRFLYNGWVRLGGVAAAMGVLFWAAFYLQGKMLRRVQLCVVISLLIHIGLALFLHEKYLALLADLENEGGPSPSLQREPITVPDYHWEQIERPDAPQSFEEPVEVETPDQPSRETPQPQPIEQPVRPEDLQTEHKLPEQQQPNPVELRRTEMLTAPKRAESLSGATISRQEIHHRPEPALAQPQPEVKISQPQLPRSTKSATAEANRRAESPAQPQISHRAPAELPAPAAQRSAQRARQAETSPQNKTERSVAGRTSPTAELARPSEALPDAGLLAAQPENRPTPEAQAAQLQRSSTDAAAQAMQPSTAGQEPADANIAAQMPRTAAQRAKSLDQGPTAGNMTTLQRGSLARAETGAELPSGAVAADNAAVPAASGAAPPSSVARVSSSAAVERSATAAPSLGSIAAAGSAEYAVGAAPVQARMGQPRTSGGEGPSVPANATAARIARSETGAATPSLAGSQGTSMPAAPAAAAGGEPALAAKVQAAGVGRDGNAGMPDTAALAGAGPAAVAAGTPGPTGRELMVRVTGRGAMPEPRSGGGASRPERQLGRGFSADARAEMPQVAAATGGGGAGTTQPAAQSGDQERQPMGHAGSLPSQPASGAPSAVGAAGPSLPASVARRAVASQEGPGTPGVSPDTSATLARSNRGLDLPAAAMPLDQPTTMGAGGPGESQGAVASRLEPGSAGGDQAANVGRTVGQIPAQVPAGAGDPTGGTSPQGVVAAAWLDRPDRGGASPGEPSVGNGRVARATGPAALPAPPSETGGQETATAPPAAVASAGTGGPAEAARADSSRRSTDLNAGPSTAALGGPSSDLAAAAGGPSNMRRSASAGASSGPEVAEVGSGPIGRRQLAGPLPGSPGPVEDVPTASLAASGSPKAGAKTPETMPSADGEAARRTGSLPVQIAALAGPGGLSYDPAAMIGVPNRHARPESEVVHPVARRFVVERSAGDLAMEGRLREMSKEAFRERDPDTRGQTARARGGSEATERAVEMGLDFLARHQFPDGHWSLDRTPASSVGSADWGPGQMNADTAGTGLSLLAFLGAGYTHREEKYRTVVRNGIDWLIANQQADGRLFNEQTDQTLYGRMYGHGIATIALCEAYGMTKDPELRGPAQRAVQFILDAQHPTQGGWRYEPRLESDTSVSGWQLMALRSAQMAGLNVPSENLRKVGRWLDLAQAAAGSRYRYNPYAADTPEQRQGRLPNRTMTAEGLLMRMYLGWERDNPALVEGAEFLKSNLPEVGTQSQPLRDSYYWYYATQVMFHMQGDHWAAWNGRLRRLLESSQLTEGPLAGSWDPQAPIADRWSQAAGRLYVTTLNLLMLEVYYRHLPLYQTLAE